MNTDRTAWLADRQTAIGASEIPSIFGVGFETPYQLWARKRGLLPNSEATDAMKVGTILQPGICAVAREFTGWQINEAHQDTFLRSTETPFIGCTPDGYVFDPNREDESLGVFEAKNVGQYVGRNWSEAPPLAVQVQTQCQMYVTGTTWAVPFALIGGNKPKWYVIDRDNKFIAHMVEKCREFWWRVEEGIAPPVDGTTETQKALQAIHPADNGLSVDLPAEFADMAASLAHLDREAKRIEQERKRLQNAIRAAIGDNTFGKLPDGSGWSWKTQTKPEQVVKASTFRVLRRTARVAADASDDEPEDSQEVIVACVDAALIKAGAELKDASPSGSRYYSFKDRRQVRVADHPPNYPTRRWMERQSVLAVRVDQDDWREQLNAILGNEIETGV